MIRTNTQRPAGGNTLALGLLLLAAFFAAILSAASESAHAATTFTVDSKGDAADENISDSECDTDPRVLVRRCTLRAAIQEANNTAGADTINFDIPGSGVKTISPASQLPIITGPLTIDGYTQTGASENTLEDVRDGTNAVLMVELDGSGISAAANGLNVFSADCVIRGLIINGFDVGVNVSTSSSNSKVEGNFVGTGPTGTEEVGNEFVGVGVAGTAQSNNTIGGATPASRNLISGNDAVGVEIDSDGQTVRGNLIGIQKDGTSALGNGLFGVSISGASNATNTANVIAFNGSDGVVVSNFGGDSSIRNRILANFIHSNRGLGIDLSGGTEDPNGVTKNDKKDPDTGPNNLQNYPILTSVTASGGQTTIAGKLNSRPRKDFTIRFFSNPPGADEGKTLRGQTTVTTNEEGKASFTFTIPGILLGEPVVTATATNKSTGDTSEFSAPAP